MPKTKREKVEMELTPFGWLIPPKEQGKNYWISDDYECVQCGNVFEIDWKEYEVIYKEHDHYVVLSVEQEGKPLCFRCGMACLVKDKILE